jgi:hypothetical protein
MPGIGKILIVLDTRHPTPVE